MYSGRGLHQPSQNTFKSLLEVKGVHMPCWLAYMFIGNKQAKKENYVCVNVCAHICMFVCICIWVYVCVCISVCISICMSVHVRVSMRMWGEGACVWARVCVSLRACFINLSLIEDILLNLNISCMNTKKHLMSVFSEYILCPNVYDLLFLTIQLLIIKIKDKLFNVFHVFTIQFGNWDFECIE